MRTRTSTSPTTRDSFSVMDALRKLAAGILSGILSLMMLVGLGRRRGTRPYRFRLALWALVLGLGGAAGTTAGCSQIGCVECYAPPLEDVEIEQEEDAGDPDPASDVPEEEGD